jgi:hypothetical protein
MKKSIGRIIKKDKSAVIVHQHDARGIWATSDRKILYRSINESSSKWIQIGKFPLSFPTDLFLFCRLARRLSRADKSNIFVSSSGNVLCVRAGKVYKLVSGKLEEMFSIHGDCFLQNSAAEHLSGNIYFGEYFRNSKRETVRIWCVNNVLSFYHVAYTFPEHSIKHVHGIYADSYVRGRLWITTGDGMNECHLYYTDDEFKTVSKIGDGSQLWRAVGLLFTEETVLWPTDSDIEQNYLIEMNRRTYAIRKVREFDASGWYSTRTEDGVYIIGLTVEKGDGIKTDSAQVMVSTNTRDWDILFSFKKDKWPMPLFKFGVVSFPYGQYSSKSFWLSGEALDGLDGCSVLCSLERKI